MSFTYSLKRLVEDNPNRLLGKHHTWQRTRLADVCSVQNGYPFESKFFRTDEHGFPLLRIRDIVDGFTKTRYSGTFDPEFIVNAGDLVVGMDGDFNARRWQGTPALLNQRVCRLSPRDAVYSDRFLANVLQGYLQAIHSKTSSITVKHLSSRTVEEIPLPLPPLAEQLRIADALDSFLSRLDAAGGSLTAAQRKLKAYRASVLKAAVEGRLVPTEAELGRSEGRVYESAGALLARMLRERRRRWEESELAKMHAAGKTPRDDRWKEKYAEPERPEVDSLPGLPEGWCWATIDQLSTLVRNGHPTPPRASSGVRTLRISAVRALAIDFQDVRYLPGHPSEYADDLVDLDDLLFTRYNGTPALVGVCGRVRFLDRDTVHPDKLIKVRLVDSTTCARTRTSR